MAPGPQPFRPQTPPPGTYGPPPPGWTYPPPPGVPPPPYYAPGLALAPSRAQDTQVLVVIAVVVVAVVAAAVLIPALTAPRFTPMVPPPQAQAPTMTLQGGGAWSAGNLSLTVTSVTSAGTVDPVDLMYVVQDPSDITYYSGSAGAAQSTGGSTVNVLFNDNLDSGRISAGDSIRITVEPAASNPLHGGVLRVFFMGDQIGTSTLP